ncbi:Vitamin B12 transporter BtuB [bioreactor metagenome]|uniref:Vitamin B12 transporter BtuB n=1 Tax=bioreactor metagenome TaxID=1076179 RepID=A0A644WUE2_9ZZZZ
MKRIVLILLLLAPVLSFGQQMISGFVYDSYNETYVSYASLRWIKDKTGTSSKSDGHFSIRISAIPDDTLEISHIGYAAKKIPAKDLTGNLMAYSIYLVPLAYNVSTVCITATREECDPMQIPQKVSLIDSADLHALPLQSIDDALIYSSGVMIDRPMGIFAAKSIVSMRGLSGDEQGRTLVLLDGIPINKSDGGTVNFNLVDPLLVDRMEVVKGPSSALYGGNAMGGVINIISAIPGEKLAGRLKLGYGTYNTMSGDLALNGFAGKTTDRGFFWSGSAMWRESDGYISEPDYMRTEYTVPAFLKEKIFSLKGGYKFKPGSYLWVSGMLFDDERGAGEKVYEELGSFSEHDSYHIRSNYRTEAGKWKINASAFFLRENYAKINEYVKSGEYTLYDVDSKRTDVGLIAHGSRKIGNANTLTTGFEIRQGAVDAADVYHTSTDKIINAGTMDMAALFAQNEFVFGKDRWKLVAGLRYDYAGFHDGHFSVENPGMNNMYLLAYENDNMAETHWNSLSPKMALQFMPKEHKRIYISYAHGFRAPILDDLCRSGKTRGGFQVANSTLVPETIENFELGYRQEFNEKIVFEPVVYFSIGKNFMYPVATGDTVDMGYAAPVIVTSNVSEVQIAGAEFDFSYRINKNLSAFANYAYAYSVVTAYTPSLAQQSDITGLYLSNVPAHLANLGFKYMYKGAGISVNTRYVGSRCVNDTNTPDEKYGLPAQYEPYVTADVRVWKEIKHRWLLGASVTNIGDKIYTDSKGQYCPGRMISFEAGINF